MILIYTVSQVTAVGLSSDGKFMVTGDKSGANPTL
jgi:hypothetical protein